MTGEKPESPGRVNETRFVEGPSSTQSGPGPASKSTVSDELITFREKCSIPVSCTAESEAMSASQTAFNVAKLRTSSSSGRPLAWGSFRTRFAHLDPNRKSATNAEQASAAGESAGGASAPATSAQRMGSPTRTARIGPTRSLRVARSGGLTLLKKSGSERAQVVSRRHVERRWMKLDVV